MLRRESETADDAKCEIPSTGSLAKGGHLTISSRSVPVAIVHDVLLSDMSGDIQASKASRRSLLLEENSVTVGTTTVS